MLGDNNMMVFFRMMLRYEGNDTVLVDGNILLTSCDESEF